MTKNGSSGSRGGGNSRVSPSYWFCFTFFSYSLEDIKRFQGLQGKYVFQEEICPDTNRKHLQGTVRFDTKKRLVTINKEYPNTHWEVCKNSKKAILYCSKEDTRVPGSMVFTNMRLPEKLRSLQSLREWQQEVWDMIQDEFREPNDKIIYWIWENKGNVGKTAFSRWLCIKHDAFYISGNHKDIKYGLSAYYNKHKYMPKVVILDIPRDTKHISYTALEKVKDGIFFSAKYESEMVIFNAPPMIVFSNREPEFERQSGDRWRTFEIVKNKLVVTSPDMNSDSSSSDSD